MRMKHSLVLQQQFSLMFTCLSPMMKHLALSVPLIQFRLVIHRCFSESSPRGALSLCLIELPTDSINTKFFISVVTVKSKKFNENFFDVLRVLRGDSKKQTCSHLILMD